MSIAKLARNLTLNKHQIWISSEVDSVSYPDERHSMCFQLEEDSFWFQHRNECIVAAIKRFPPQGGILEVGGGNGYVTRRILDENIECALLEPGIIGALNAKRGRKIPEVICSTLEGAMFEKEKLAAVAMFDVIEHVEDDQGMVDQISDLLKPGGLFYCTVPVHGWLWSGHDVEAGHFRRYNKAGLEALLSQQFELLYSSCFFSILVLPMFLFRALPFRILGGRSMFSPKTEHSTGSGHKIGNILQGLLSKEVEKIKSGKKIVNGTSMMIIARKRK